MRVWAVRIVVAAGLAANAALIPHPYPMAVAQVVLAAVVLSGGGGPAGLAGAALALLPAPIAEVRRLLGHVPLACDCERTSGWRGIWPVAGAAVDVALIGLTVWLARARAAKRSGAATES